MSTRVQSSPPVKIDAVGVKVVGRRDGAVVEEFERAGDRRGVGGVGELELDLVVVRELRRRQRLAGQHRLRSGGQVGFNQPDQRRAIAADRTIRRSS